jgi:hypothetical protein
VKNINHSFSFGFSPSNLFILISNYYYYYFIINFFLLIFVCFIFIICVIEHEIFFAKYLGITQTTQESQPTFYVLNVGIANLRLTKLMFILWPLCRYFTLNFMFIEVLLVQECNITIRFKLIVLGKIFSKVLMQCSHSRHANIIQMWDYNCNKTKYICIDANITFIKTF